MMRKRQTPTVESREFNGKATYPGISVHYARHLSHRIKQSEDYQKTLRTDTTREILFKRKLINYTKNELQGINILKLRLPNGLKCCLKFCYCRNG